MLTLNSRAICEVSLFATIVPERYAPVRACSTRGVLMCSTIPGYFTEPVGRGRRAERPSRFPPDWVSPRRVKPEPHPTSHRALVAELGASSRSLGQSTRSPRRPLHHAGALLAMLASARTTSCREPGLGRKAGVQDFSREGGPGGSRVCARRALGHGAPSFAYRMRRAVAGLLLVIAGLVAVPTLAHAQTTVPSNWALTPSGLSAGDSFRLIFATSTNVNATSSNIGEYNTVVQAAPQQDTAQSRPTRAASG